MAVRRPPAVCPACHTPPRRRFRLSNRAWLKQCPRCLLAWWDWPALDPAAFYDESYFQSAEVGKGYDDYAGLEAGLRRTARARLRRIRRRGVPDSGQPRALLDIGCGTGIFLDEARRAGWQVRGVEVSAYATQQARRRGLDVACGSVEELELLAGAYDCVTLWDTLEHVSDPAGVLEVMARVLRPGGTLALSTGDVSSLCARLTGSRWHLFNLPEHLYFFSPAALARLLARAGCQVLQVAHEVNWLPVSYLLERLRKSLGCATALERWRLVRTRLQSSGTRVAAVVPATLWDVLGVYAVRTGLTLAAD
jgi:2-polyprenyl-3-methyl-5-hydroxy-6-metoxy-1,4-benzoquinol methylase